MGVALTSRTKSCETLLCRKASVSAALGSDDEEEEVEGPSVISPTLASGTKTSRAPALVFFHRSNERECVSIEDGINRRYVGDGPG